MKIEATKIRVQTNDLLFFSLKDASEDDVDGFRKLFDEVYPGVDAMFLNFNIQVQKVNKSGVKKIVINCADGVSKKDVLPLKGLVTQAVQESSSRKKRVSRRSRYTLIKE